MKKSGFSFLLLAGVFITVAHSAEWRVNSNPAAMPHFTSISQAVGNEQVVDGDVLLLEANSVFSDESRISKSLTIVGTGYFLVENGVSSWSANPPMIYNLCFMRGSDNSKVSGCKIMNVGYLSVDHSFSNIIIERSQVGSCMLPLPNITLRNCLIGGNIQMGANSNCIGNIVVIENNNGANNFSITSEAGSRIANNTFIIGAGTASSSMFGYNTRSTTYDNNIFWAERVAYIIPTKETLNSCIFNKNVFNFTTEETPTSIVINNIFVGEMAQDQIFQMTGTPDGKWRLKAGSPAIGSAFGGGDCGAYGGLFPYILSGIPADRPYFTDISIADRPTDDGKLPVTIKVKAQ